MKTEGSDSTDSKCSIRAVLCGAVVFSRTRKPFDGEACPSRLIEGQLQTPNASTGSVVSATKSSRQEAPTLISGHILHLRVDEGMRLHPFRSERNRRPDAMSC